MEIEINLLKNSTFNEDIYSNHIKLEEVNNEIDLLEKQLLKLELEYLEYLNHLEQ